MIIDKKLLIIALVVPIIGLGGLILSKQYNVETGKQITLPIKPYDPRDLLAGHYMQYQIDYGVPEICSGVKDMKIRDAYICLDPKYFTYDKKPNCHTLIHGNCVGDRFVAGVERFYIPESLSNLNVTEGTSSVVLKVTSDGTAQAVGLIINGRNIP